MIGSRPRRSPHGFLFWRIYGHGLLLLLLVALTLAGVGWALGRHLPPREPEKVVAWLAARADERRGDPERLAAELRELRDGLGLDATVFDPSGAVVVAVGTPAAALDPAERTALDAGPVKLGSRRFAFAAALPSGGYLVVAPGPHATRWGRWALLLAAVLGVLAIGSWPTARSIAAPLERLTAAARRLGEGELGTRAGIRVRGEVGELAVAFDEMAERLERLVRTERELLANVSHELRTPLARIRVALELAAEGDLDRARRYLVEIGADLSELDRLVEEILTAARLDGVAAGGLPLHRAPVDVAALVGEIVERFRLVDPGRPLSLEAAAPLPEVEGDGALLRRLVENLLDNARKYSDPGAPVTLAVRGEAGRLLVEVTDRGIGIDPEDLPRLFTPFFRAERGRARGAGIGLGLALAKRIAEAHGGSIAAEAAPGQGTTFRVSLPAGRPASPRDV